MANDDSKARQLAVLNDTVAAHDVVVADAVYGIDELSQALPAGTTIAVVDTGGVSLRSVPISTSNTVANRLSFAEWMHDGSVVSELSRTLAENDAKRLIVVVGDNDPDTGLLEPALSEQGVGLFVAKPDAGVSKDDFISEEESEAVAERLRRLGYM